MKINVCHEAKPNKTYIETANNRKSKKPAKNPPPNKQTNKKKMKLLNHQRPCTKNDLKKEFLGEKWKSIALCDQPSSISAHHRLLTWGFEPLTKHEI